MKSIQTNSGSKKKGGTPMSLRLRSMIDSVKESFQRGLSWMRSKLAWVLDSLSPVGSVANRIPVWNTFSDIVKIGIFVFLVFFTCLVMLPIQVILKLLFALFVTIYISMAVVNAANMVQEVVAADIKTRIYCEAHRQAFPHTVRGVISE